MTKNSLDVLLENKIFSSNPSNKKTILDLVSFKNQIKDFYNEDLCEIEDEYSISSQMDFLDLNSESAIEQVEHEMINQIQNYTQKQGLGFGKPNTKYSIETQYRTFFIETIDKTNLKFAVHNKDEDSFYSSIVSLESYPEDENLRYIVCSPLLSVKTINNKLTQIPDDTELEEIIAQQFTDLISLKIYSNSEIFTNQTTYIFKNESQGYKDYLNLIPQKPKSQKGSVDYINAPEHYLN